MNLTVKEAAARLRLSEQRVRRLADEERFPNASRFGNAWVIPLADVEAFTRKKPGWPAGRLRGPKKKQEVQE